VPTRHHPRASRLTTGLKPPASIIPTGGTTTGDRPATGDDQHSSIDESVRVSATVAGFDGAPIATITRYREPGDAELDGDRPLTVVAVVGDVDGDTAPTLRMVLTEAITGQSQVCCDLAQVAFLGAAGANALLAAHRDASAADCHFTLRGVHGIAQWTLVVTGLNRVLTQRY
jgi:anti-anti-sigma factor